MPIYEIDNQAITKLSETSFGEHGIRERYDLQRLLRESIDVIAPGVMVLAEEFAIGRTAGAASICSVWTKTLISLSLN